MKGTLTNFNNKEYSAWLTSIKSRIQTSQMKATLSVNAELVKLYWELGKTIVERQTNAKWGDGIILQLSKDLQAAFPEIKGFSMSNLKFIKKCYQFYNQDVTIGQQVVSQLQNTLKKRAVITSNDSGFLPIQKIIEFIPWGHNLQIINKCKSLEEGIFYIIETINNNWSRSILVHQIESDLYHRQGKLSHNFAKTLPDIQSDLAKELFKDPYKFDFLTIGNEAIERDLENALIEHITSFLLELGAGFAYLGKQYQLEVGGDDFYLDLLFYHLKLRSYVVIDLKTGKFKPEYTGKMNFYLSAVDDKLKIDTDQPSIGIIICKEKNKVVAEYALRDLNKPMGIAEYRISESLPETIKGYFPSIEAIEEELEKPIEGKRNREQKTKASNTH